MKNHSQDHSCVKYTDYVDHCSVVHQSGAWQWSHLIGRFNSSAPLFGSVLQLHLLFNFSYNVIVKGLSAKPLTNGGAMLRILFVWGFSGIWTIFPLFGWNRYVPEGNMTACGTDYITKDWFSRSYILFYSLACYYAPLFLIIYSYWFIVQVCWSTS